MRQFLLILIFCFLFLLEAISQMGDLSVCPEVEVTSKLSKYTFKFGEDIRLTIALKNNSRTTQSVWFDRPKSSTGGPAWTSVILTEKKTGRSMLKYSNKAILQSQVYTTEQIRQYSYQLKPGQNASGQFSLYDLAVVKNYSQRLNKGTYKMQVFYCSVPSDPITFTVD